jgi:hypothetical protein
MDYHKGKISSYISKLRDYNKYDFKKEDIKFEYEYTNELTDLAVRYNLYSIAGDTDEISRIINLMKWVHITIEHNGQVQSMPEKFNTDSIIEFAKKNGANCWHMASMLAEVYLACGFKARYVRCMPYDYKDGDCHVVTIVFSEKLNKWVMMDPTVEGYFKDGNGILLSLDEIRSALINQTELYVNESLNWNGSAYDKEEYVAYFSKNLFRFESLKLNGYSAEDKENKVYIDLSPVNYDSKESKLKNIQWLKENFRDKFISNPLLAERMNLKEKQAVSNTIYTHNDIEFWDIT